VQVLKLLLQISNVCNALVVSTPLNDRIQHSAQRCGPCTSVHGCKLQLLYAL